jgi:uncharacterized membrane protein YvlD (DUF360 family)
MNYLRSLFLNFLIVFFVDRAIPGIHIDNFENVPNIGADILFSLIVGFLNASVFFFLALLELTITPLRLALMTFIISFGAFAIISVVPFGIQVLSPLGFFLGSTLVWAIALLTNFLEWKHYKDQNLQ